MVKANDIEKAKNFIQYVDLQIDGDESIKDESFFREQLQIGIDKLYELKDKYKDKSAIILALGPTLLEFDKQEYEDCLKITCNEFWKVPNFFYDKYKPDFWVAANSLAAVKKSFSICSEQNINAFITIPNKGEFERFLENAKKNKKIDLVIPWLWGQYMFQIMLARKYDCPWAYSRGNTVTLHMIAFALWLGCKEIYITGFDMSYSSARERTGGSHAGFDDVDEEAQTDFERSLRLPILMDLRYLCVLAKFNNIKIINMSHKVNKLPYNLSEEV